MFLFCKRRLEVIVKKLFSARADCVSDSNVQYLFLIFMRIKVETDWHGLEVMM